MVYSKKHLNLIALLLVFMIAGGVLVATSLSSLSLVGLNLSDDISEGYEGAKARWEGIDVQPNYRVDLPQRFTYRLGDSVYSPPTYASTWSFNRGTFNIDLDKWDGGLHNLVGIVKGGGVTEKIPGSDRPLTYTVEWDKVVEKHANGTQTVKHFQAGAFFFKQEVELKPSVDESLGFANIILSSEKGGYWSDFNLVLRVRVLAWDPLGNYSSWAKILGVEVADTNYVSGVNAVKDEQFYQSQMLPLYRSFDAAIGKSGAVSSSRGQDAVSKVAGSDPDPSGGDLLTDVYVSLPYSRFGMDAKGQFADWQLNQHIVVLRVHVLKMDAWIAVQQVGSKFKPSEPKGTGFENLFLKYFGDLGARLSKWLSDPLNVGAIFGVVIIIVVVIGLIVLAPLLLKGYLASKVAGGLRILNISVASPGSVTSSSDSV